MTESMNCGFAITIIYVVRDGVDKCLTYSCFRCVSIQVGATGGEGVGSFMHLPGTDRKKGQHIALNSQVWIGE